MDNNLINRETLKKAIGTIKEMALDNANEPLFEYVELNPLLNVIDNIPTEDVIPNKEGYEMYNKGYMSGYGRDKKDRLQDIKEIIDELESRKSYGVEYAQAMEDVIVILKAKFGMGEKTDDD